MSIYVTGDCHGSFERFSDHRIRKNLPELAENDIIIIAGDIGLIWGEKDPLHVGPYLTKLSKNDLYWKKWLENKPYTFLFVDGNHENFDLLESFPHVEKFGSQAGQIGTNIFHLLRGQIYNICGKTFFTMGGATSIDKSYRTPHISWWSREIPTSKEWETAFKNLDAYDWNVDYVITHTAPDYFLNNRRDFEVWPDGCPVRQMLNRIAQNLTWKKWYFGHYHEDYDDPKINCVWLYKGIKKIL